MEQTTEIKGISERNIQRGKLKDELLLCKAT